MRPAPLLTLFLTACCTIPPDGHLAEGTWGGDPEPTSLTVHVDGTGSLDLACTGGSSVGTIDVAGGVVSAVFSFDPDSWGPDTPEEHDPFDVVLDATVCGERLEGTAVGDPEWVGTVELSLVLGRGRGFEVPCAQ